MWVLPSVVPRLGFIPFGAVPPPSTLLNINFDSFGLYHSLYPLRGAWWATRSLFIIGSAALYRIITVKRFISSIFSKRGL